MELRLSLCDCVCVYVRVFVVASISGDGVDPAASKHAYNCCKGDDLLKVLSSLLSAWMFREKVPNDGS